jgi:anti-sigma regulatory factor (Ser/Thr protein kinase)
MSQPDHLVSTGDSGTELHYTFKVEGGDFGSAGSVSTGIKKILQQIGVKPETVRKTAIATYEAEINVVIHASQGEILLTANRSAIQIVVRDKGPGIPDVDLAMQPGYSTASEAVREMGFGAGMGLPNMQRCADTLNITSKVGEGTIVEMIFTNE